MMRLAAFSALVGATVAQRGHDGHPPRDYVGKAESATTTAGDTLVDVAGTTTAQPAVLNDDLYVLKYPMQACSWSYYSEGTDWMMSKENDDSVNAATCAEACVAQEGCTGFEVGLTGFSNGPYCALWLNGACTVPDESFQGAFSVTTGDAIDVSTYTMTLPIDAFAEYENQACAWSYYVEGEDWEFASKNSDSAAACAELCLDQSAPEDGGCTGFEVGISMSTQYGDISQGYCALWYNNTCGPNDMLPQRTQASTYVLLSSLYGGDCHGHFFYVGLILIGFIMCISLCCCCRRAMLRRRALAMRRAADAARVARRASPGASVSAAVTVPGHSGTRAVVYAVEIGDDNQEEPVKV